MWSTETERKKPPLVPGSEKQQPTMVSAELEALRQRGLAKILNKHFTETTRKLATEKAAAEAAMRDLQQRQDTQPADGALDSLFMSVHQWRNECRQKERETLLLFQRYVEKFGFTGQVSAPEVAGSSSAGWQATTNPNAPPSPAVSAKLAAPPPHNTPLPAVPNITAAIEEQLEEYIKNGAISFPSLELLGLEETFQGVHSKEEAEFRNYYRRQLEHRGVDVKAPSYNLGSDGKFVYQGPTFVRQQHEEEDRFNNLDPFARPSVRNDVDDEEEDSDDVLGDLMVREAHALETDSVVSGLTSINSAVTREVLHECEKSVAEFLKVEQEAIRQVMTAEDDAVTANSSSAQSEIGSATKRAADQAETMAKQMQDILNDFNKQKSEQLHLLEGRPYETSNSDEKWMIYYDETYKREYYHELNTNRTQWEPPEQQQDVESTMNHSSSQFMYDEVMPELSSPSAISRIAMYRRRKRKERKRRLMVLAILTITFIAGSAVYMYQKHSFKAEQLRMQQELAEEEARVAAETAARAAREREMEEARKRAERERAERERLERERLALEAQRAMEVAEQLAREKQQQQQQQLALKRPWGCNIPLAYIVHGQCRRLASDNPVFDLHSLVSCMMQ